MQQIGQVVAVRACRACCWPSAGGLRFRVVNMPRFADFLIAVEAEMNKVSWPSRSELVRSSIVVLITIFVLAVVLFAYDMFWGVVAAGIGRGIGWLTVLKSDRRSDEFEIADRDLLRT